MQGNTAACLFCSFLVQYVNPCAAYLFVRIFHSFEAGIADAISSFKWMENNIIYEKYGLSSTCVKITVYPSRVSEESFYYSMLQIHQKIKHT